VSGNRDATRVSYNRNSGVRRGYTARVAAPTRGGGMNTPEDVKSDHSAWPEGVEPISWVNIDRLGVGQDNQLYWDGRRVETRSRLDLTFWQKVIAGVTGLAVIAGGLGGLSQGIDAGHNFGCKLHWWIEGCRR
jgi:hypothetical protein